MSVYETRIDSVRQLLEKVKHLDADEGIRIDGREGGRLKLVFVTRHTGRYAVAICDSKGRSKKGEAAMESTQIREFKEGRSLRRFLEGVIAKPLRAYLY